MQLVQNALIPVLLAVTGVYALYNGVDVFPTFLIGAKKGIKTAAEILPTMIGMLTVVQTNQRWRRAGAWQRDYAALRTRQLCRPRGGRYAWILGNKLIYAEHLLRAFRIAKNALCGDCSIMRRCNSICRFCSIGEALFPSCLILYLVRSVISIDKC